MIVPSMSSQELANEIISDFKNVYTKTGHIMKKTHRMALKSRKKHYQQMFEYKSPLKNDWLIFVNHYLEDPIFVPVVYYLNEYGINGIMISQNPVNDEYSYLSGKARIQQDMYHYTSHFLDRYNQRFLNDEGLSKLDLLKHFIQCNQMVQARTYSDNDKYKDGIYGRFNQGIGLGYMEELSTNNLFHFKTFLTTEMIYENQDDYLKQTSIEDISLNKDFWGEVYGRRNIDSFG